MLLKILDWNAQRGIERIVLYYSEQLSGVVTVSNLLDVLEEKIASLEAPKAA